MVDQAGGVMIHGPLLLLRALRAGEIDEEWRAMVGADPMTIAELPDEASFKARLLRSGQLADGWLDLAIDLGGDAIGRIQTFVPPGPAAGPGCVRGRYRPPRAGHAGELGTR